jgi:DNA-binding transcriptional MerR regulator
MERIMAVITKMPTIGEIAERFGVPSHRIVYVVESRHIEPSGIAGHARVFDEAAVQRIGSELRRIAEDRRATW